jgi:hypothetical protein
VCVCVFAARAQSLLGVEQSFESHIDKLRPLKFDILDVKATRWHDANNAFKSGLRDLGACAMALLLLLLLLLL